MCDELQGVLKRYQEKLEELEMMIATIKAIEGLGLQFFGLNNRVLDLRKIELHYGDLVWLRCPDGVLEQMIVPEPSTDTDWEEVRLERQAAGNP